MILVYKAQQDLKVQRGLKDCQVQMESQVHRGCQVQTEPMELKVYRVLMELQVHRVQ